MSSQEHNLLCNIYNQYSKTNLETLVQGICDISKEHAVGTNEILDEYFNLNVATKDRLDNFGKLLNFNRYITFNDPLDVVLPTSPGIEQYEVLIAPDFKKCRLSDDAYRQVLRLILQTRNTVASVTTLSKIISDTINADVFVGDAMDMRYITFYFLDRIPGFLEVCIHNYDILPRPAGMATQYISAISRYFGFVINVPYFDLEATAKVITAFWKSRFPEATKGIILLPFERQVRELPPYVPTEITEQELMRAKQMVKLAQIQQMQEHVKLAKYEAYIASLVDEDQQVLDKVKQYINASFSRYTYALEYFRAPSTETDYENTKGMLLEAYLGTREANDRYYQQQRYIHKYRQMYKHRDPRKDLFYDKKSGWYFYKEPDADGSFRPEYIANIYQDSCGVWYPQESLYDQLVRKQVILRHEDYASNKLEKYLNNSPFLDKYRDIETESYNTGKWEEIRRLVHRMHDSVKVWHKANKINESSFRAVLDHEYQNANMIMYRNYLRDRYIDTASSLFNAPGRDIRKRYWNELFRELNTYFGRNRSYKDAWNDYDTDAPVYKRKLFIKTQRYYVREAKNSLSTAYNSQKSDLARVGDENSSFATQYGNDLVKAVKDLLDDISRSFYQPIEIGTFQGGHNSEYYSQKNLSNKQLPNEENWNRSERDKYEKIKDAYQQAVWSCEALMKICDEGKSVQGQFYNSWYCALKNELNDPPDFSNRKDWMSHDHTGWAHNSNWYCQTSNNWRNGDFKKQQQEGNLSWAWGKYNRHKAAYDAVQQEKQIRSLVTEDRSLQDIINNYDSYTPRSPIPDIDDLEREKLVYDWSLPDGSQ